jgi:hypothetical protein
MIGKFMDDLWHYCAGPSVVVNKLSSLNNWGFYSGWTSSQGLSSDSGKLEPMIQSARSGQWCFFQSVN